MSDLFIEINYPINEPEKYSINSNVKEKKIKDLLLEWTRGQMGRGEDSSSPNDVDVYHIRIEIDLSYDTFTCKSDTGNKGLTAGIVMDVIKRIKDD